MWAVAISHLVLLLNNAGQCKLLALKFQHIIYSYVKFIFKTQGKRTYWVYSMGKIRVTRRCTTCMFIVTDVVCPTNWEQFQWTTSESTFQNSRASNFPNI